MSTPEKRKAGWKVSFLDILLLLIMLGSAAILVGLLTSDRVRIVTKNETVNVRYQVEVTALRETWRGLVAIGDTVVDTASQSAIGTVVDITYADCLYTGYDSTTGAAVSSPYPDHVNMTLTVEAEAVVSDGRYTVGSWTLVVGQQLQFRVPALTASGNCTTLEEVENHV